MHLEHGVPAAELHLVEGAVTQDAGIADHAVDLAELVDRGLDDVGGAFGFGDGVVVGDGTTACVTDLLDHLVGHGRSGTGAVARSAEVVDDDAGTLAGERQRILAPESASCARNDDDTILHSWH